MTSERSWRIPTVVVLTLLLVGSCTAADDVPASNVVTTAPATSTSLPPQATSTLPASTTTAVSVASHAEMLIFAAVGPTFTSEPERVLVWGDVSEEATVTINDVPTRVDHIGRTTLGPDWWRWNDADEADGGVVVPLDLGLNTIRIKATFTDGSNLTHSVQRQYDPALVPYEGYILSLEPGDPSVATVELAEFVHDEWGVSDPKTRSEIVEVPIADGVVFQVIPLMEPWSTSVSLTDMLELQELNRQGPLEGLWWDIIFPPHADDRAHKAAPWEFLITQDGSLQQASQLYSP